MTTKRKIDTWLAQARPEDVEVPVCLNRELLTEYNRVLEDYKRFEETRKARSEKFGESGGTMVVEEDPADNCLLRLDHLQAKIDADKAEHLFRFRKMPYKEFCDLIESHPATDASKQRFPYHDHDPFSIAVPLVAASCIHPKMETEDADSLREALPENVWFELYEAAMAVNRTGVVIPKAVSSTVAQLVSELMSTTPQEPESPSPSSEEESSKTENPSGLKAIANGRSSGKKNSGTAAPVAETPKTNAG